MATPPQHYVTALAPLGSMLSADGYELEVSEEGADVLVARIVAGPDACADCLVPKDMMRRYFIDALRPVCEFGPPEIRLLYPNEA